MSLVETLHAEHKARLYRMGGQPKPKPAYTPPAPVIKPIDPEPYYAGMWFYNLVTHAGKPLAIRIEDIQIAVCRHYRISRHDMISGRRTANIVFPRQVAYYLSKKLTLRSLPEIGRRFGGKDHTTVLHGIRKIEALEALMDTDTMGQISAIKAELLS